MIPWSHGKTRREIFCRHNRQETGAGEVQDEVGQDGLVQGSEDPQEETSGSLPREKMTRIYLDSNVLIAHYSTDKAEDEKKKWVENALDVFAELKDVELCTSMWAVTEMVNVLVS